MDYAGWIDQANPLAHGLDLGLTQGRTQRMHLSVDIGFGNMVHIDQCQAANAAACKCLRGPRADATNANDGNM